MQFRGMKLIPRDPDELDPYPAQKQPPYRTDITAAPIADAPASDRFRAQPLPATESSLASAEDPRLAQVRLTRTSAGSGAVDARCTGRVARGSGARIAVCLRGGH